MYVFTSDKFEGNLIDCNEGDLQWIDKDKVTQFKRIYKIIKINIKY